MHNVFFYGGCGNSSSLKANQFKWCIVLVLWIIGLKKRKILVVKRLEYTHSPSALWLAKTFSAVTMVMATYGCLKLLGMSSCS